MKPYKDITKTKKLYANLISECRWYTPNQDSDKSIQSGMKCIIHTIQIRSISGLQACSTM